MPVQKIKIFIAALLLLGSMPVHADFAGTMSDMFGSLTNVTPPMAYDSQRRHVYSGGSLYLRNPITRANILNFTPPRFGAGCNGIDMFGGSFSFINKAQFEALMRSVASGSLGYAFGLALEAMCPTCAQEMKYLQKVVQEVNGMMGDSCKMAESLVNTVGAPLKSWRDQRKKTVQPGYLKSQGISSDFFEGWGDNNKTEKETDADMAIATETNVVWDALQQQNVAAWWASGDNELLEIMMSVTGTIIKSDFKDDGTTLCDIGDDDGDGLSDGDEYCIRPKDGVLTFSDIFSGSSPGTAVQKYTCNDVACLYPTSDSVADFKGFKQRVANILLGDAATGMALGNVGIVNKIRDKTATLSVAEIAFIKAAPAPILEMIRNAGMDAALAVQVAQQMVDIIAIEMTVNFIEQASRQIYAAVETEEMEMNTTVLAKIEQVKKDGAAQHQKASKQIANISSYLANYDLVIKKLSQRMQINLTEQRVNILKTR